MVTLRTTLEAIGNDFNTNVNGKKFHQKIIGFLFTPAFHVLFLYRLIHYFESKPVLGVIGTILGFFLNILYGCYIHPSAILGCNIRLPHPIAIVIGQNVAVGNAVSIYQSVTLGSHGRPDDPMARYPVIGDNVTIFANSVIVGGIHIGENSIIGAGSVVLDDIPANVIAAGTPARIIRQL